MKELVLNLEKARVEFQTLCQDKESELQSMKQENAKLREMLSKPSQNDTSNLTHFVPQGQRREAPLKPQVQFTSPVKPV